MLTCYQRADWLTRDAEGYLEFCREEAFHLARLQAYPFAERLEKLPPEEQT